MLDLEGGLVEVQLVLHLKSIMAEEIRLDELTLEKVDYEWIEKCTKIKHLKKAIRLIEADGDYFTELKAACQTRLEALDPSIALRRQVNHIPEDQKERILQDIYAWEDAMTRREKSTIMPEEEDES